MNNKLSMYKKTQKHQFLPLEASYIEMDMATDLSINTKFDYASRIFDLKIQKDLSSITNVIVRKPLYRHAVGQQQHIIA